MMTKLWSADRLYYGAPVVGYPYPYYRPYGYYRFRGYGYRYGGWRRRW